MKRATLAGRFSRRSVAPWSDTEPIRAEIFGRERFEQHATSLADSHMIVDRGPKVVSIVERLEDNAAALADDHQALLTTLREKRPITPAAEWIIDNFHIVDRNVRQVRLDLPPRYFKQLPDLGSGFLAGHPRIFGIMWAYVAHTDSLFDPDLLAHYVRAYEARKALSLGELWAAAITLRLLLLENLRRLADRIVRAAADRERADEIADRLLGLGAKPAQPLGELVDVIDRGLDSRPFAVQLVRRMRDQIDPGPAQWIIERLAGRGLDPERIVDEEHLTQSATTVTVRNIFTSLRLIGDVDWSEWLENVSLVEEELRGDAGYVAQDFPSRNLYRSAVEELARRAHRSEIDVARAALHQAREGTDPVTRDPGFWLVDDGRPAFEKAIGFRPTWHQRAVTLGRRVGLLGYLGSALLCVALTLSATVLLLDRSAGGLPAIVLTIIAALGLIPFSDLALSVVNQVFTRGFHASILPGLAFRAGVPVEHRTLVAIPTLLDSINTVDELVDLLEVHYLANASGEIYFALVTDLLDSPAEHAEGDNELVTRARLGVERLNELHGEYFLLLHRARRFNPADGVWMGWERKRGKLVELNRLLRGDDTTSYSVVEGRVPYDVKYVLTLDSDTRLPRDAARRLIGKIGHPLNRPVWDPVEGRVRRGFGVLQPRVTPSLPMNEASSYFQRVFSTPPGLDPYAFAVSDVYQDLFGEGSFSGKGIYDVDAVMASTAKRIPENRVLSHDLLEGNYARSGLVTDVEVVEQFPMSYEVAAARAHRWARGDWQLLPWIIRRRPGISRLGRWKMFDNLRRTLSPISLVAGLIAGLAVLPPMAAFVWSLVLIATFFGPPLIPVFTQLRYLRSGITLRSQLSGFVDDLARGVVRGLLNSTFLGHHAWLMVDATLRSWFRMGWSRRRLLEWTTAAQVAAGTKGTVNHYIRLMWGGFVPALLALVAGIAGGPWQIAVAIVVAVVWLVAPIVAAWVCVPYDSAEVAASDEDLAALRLVARRTWRYFETFVTAEDHHLPPDNFQEDPAPVVAHRTSPTNIGLYFLSVVAARDLGWIGTSDALERMERTMGSIDALEHVRGHLFNWYDTTTLAPLPPRYISTVDNGNLASHLLVAANACREWIDADAHGIRAAGIRDGLALLHETLTRTSRDPALLEELDRLLDDIPTGESAVLDDERMARTRTLLERAAWASVRSEGNESYVWAEATLATIESQQRDDQLPASGVAARNERLADLEGRLRDEVVGMDFAFLLDRRRGLMSIGYQAEEERLDGSCYDLLASEARVASYMAIAKGDVRTRHWFRLGRPMTAVHAGAALLSWSGSMFEYLMPMLVMRSPAASLLERTADLVVRRQIAYGNELGVPWGISESAYNGRDIDLTYQYSQFGIPGLGIVRGLADDVVVAPYATGLAAMVAPGEAAANYDALTALGARGRFGFYEAVDFTPSRRSPDERYAVVRCYMAHHQGMTIVGIHNAVLDGLMRYRFHIEPMVRAAALLLQERAPRDVPVTGTHRAEVEAAPSVRTMTPPVERRFSGDDLLVPTTHQLSNGRLTLCLTPSAGSQLRWGSMVVNRWRADPTCDEGGDRVYLSDIAAGRWWSATPMPVPDRRDPCEVRFGEDRAVYRRRHGTISTELEYHVSPESDVVVRRLTVRNHARRARTIAVTSYSELVLGPAADDLAHPAFSKMFVHTEYLDEYGALIATRRRRSPEQPEMWAAHMFVVEHGEAEAVQYETDRLRFLGRNGTARNAAQLQLGRQPSNTTGDVLDPIFSLRQTLQVPGRASARLLIWTLVASTREELLDLIDRHRAAGAYERVVMLAWTQNQVQLRHLGISADEASQYQALGGMVAFPRPGLRPPESTLARDRGAQSALWALGVSGDLPIVLVLIDDDKDLHVVRQVVQAFEYWHRIRLAVDLVVLNERSTSYVESLHDSLHAAAGSVQVATHADGPTGSLHIVRADHVAPEAIRVLCAAARVTIVARRGDIAAQVRLGLESGLDAVTVGAEPVRRPPPVLAQPFGGGEGLQHFNGIGGFDPDRREYVIVLDGANSTPAPWTNVVANEQFGFHATAEGAGYTWWRNSRDNQLTPWRNDPVSSPLSEAIYVRNDVDGALCSPTARPIAHGRHVTRHGFGVTQYLHTRPDLGLDLDLVQFVPHDDPIKISRLRLTNLGQWPASFTVTWYAEAVLGLDRQQTADHLVTEHDTETNALFVRNPWSTEYADQIVFVDFAGRQSAWTGDRREFLGARGTMEWPIGVVAGQPLSNRVGAAADPCLAMQQQVAIGPGQTADVTILFGAAHDAGAARQLIAKHRERPADDVLTDVRSEWERRLSAIRVRTPDPAFDVMMNGWLLYQTIAGRMLARSGYYQASGAYGFRDQLQDSMAIVLVDAQRAREHLLRAAGRQFVEGDVQHWWLPATGAGVRTRISDDVVWLAHATARYVRVTGDAAVLDEHVPFIEGQSLAPDDHEVLFTPSVSETTASLYDHCVLGLKRALPVGDHGLPLIGTGDWNDGMNRVGAAGRGESIWLGWFLHRTLSDFADVAVRRGDTDFATRATTHQHHLEQALERHGWDGKWYRRAFFDDGRPLGSAQNEECRIDAIAQSWAVLSGAAEPSRATAAMDEVTTQLVTADDGIARLFTPPFERSEPDPGYIRAYPPGVRENGGQYTHGATWSVFAHAALGREDRAGSLFSMLNPVNHARTPADVLIYRVEPYVVAADVYSMAPHVGRGGWTWYTGASGWLYRAGLEAVLGLTVEGEHLRVQPCLPPEWTFAEVTLIQPRWRARVTISASSGWPRRIERIELDGAATHELTCVTPPPDGEEHHVHVVMGPA